MNRGGQIKGNHIPRSDMRKRLIAKITAAVESPDKTLEGWPTSYDDHSINVVQETKVEDYEMYGCPKPVSLDEALRRPRGGGRTERVAVVPETEVDEVVDSDAIRWDERQNLLASSRSEGSFRSSKRFRTNDDRKWLGGSRWR